MMILCSILSLISTMSPPKFCPLLLVCLLQWWFPLSFLLEAIQPFPAFRVFSLSKTLIFYFPPYGESWISYRETICALPLRSSTFLTPVTAPRRWLIGRGNQSHRPSFHSSLLFLDSRSVPFWLHPCWEGWPFFKIIFKLPFSRGFFFFPSLLLSGIVRWI